MFDSYHFGQSFTIVVFLLIVFGCESPKKEEKSDLIKDENGKIIEGTFKQYFSDGSVRREAPYKDGKLNGTVKIYYENGAIKSEIHYENGVKEGKARRYYKEGPIYMDSFYHNGKVDGIQRKYHANGNLMSESVIMQGLPCLGLKEYYTSGKQKVLPEIQFETQDQLLIDGYYALKMKMSNGSKNVTFYLGRLNKDGCLTNDLEIVRSEDGVGVLDVILNPGEMISEDLQIVAKNVTRLRNSQIVSASYRLNIVNKPK